MIMERNHVGEEEARRGELKNKLAQLSNNLCLIYLIENPTHTHKHPHTHVSLL